jgi:nucleotide-binding universal stress UspA family protein
MFKRILFPTDFSLHADKIVECIPDLISLGMKETILVHVINPMKAARWIRVDEQIIDKAQREARRSMEEVVEKLTTSYGIAVKYRIELGIIYRELERTAHEEQADLIVMGSHGHGFMKGAFLGSVSQNMLRITTLPLIIEKFKHTEKNGRENLEFVSKRMFTRLLFPTDFSENSLLVLRMLTYLRNAGAEEIIVVHVQDIDRLWYLPQQKIEEFNQIDTERLSQLKRRLEFLGYGVETLLKHADPVKEINTLSEEKDVSMIIMGSHGKSAIKDSLTGSVAETVALCHVRPLIVIPRNWNTDRR